MEVEFTGEGRIKFILTLKNIKLMPDRGPSLSYTLGGNVPLDVALISHFETLTS